MTLLGDTPRALARAADGSRVFVAIHHSGNRTTAINNGFVCDGFSQSTSCSIGGLLTAPGGVPGPSQNFQGLQSAPVFTFPNDAERRNSEAFMLQFDNDIAPIVGQQVTLDASNAAVSGPRIDLLIARAAAPFTSLLLDGATTECELVVKGAESGEPRGWLRLPSGFFPADDDPDQSQLVTDAALRASVSSSGPLTYTCVAPGSGIRVGINRDLDVRLDALDNCPGHVNDDQADFDGDGLGDSCDPTPLPEPGIAAGLAAGLALLVGSRQRTSRARRSRLPAE